MSEEWLNAVKRVKNRACWYAERQNIESMLAQGVDINYRSQHGLSALDILMHKEVPSIDLLQVLLDAGIDLHSHYELYLDIKEQILDDLYICDEDTLSVNHAKLAIPDVYIKFMRAMEADEKVSKQLTEKWGGEAKGIDKHLDRLQGELAKLRTIEQIKNQLSAFSDTAFVGKERDIIAPWQSKFCGVPYLPESFELPDCFSDKNLKFAFQINFEEIRDTGVTSLLPDTGLLQVYLYPSEEDSGDYPDERLEVIYLPDLNIDIRQWQPLPERQFYCGYLFHSQATGIKWSPFIQSPIISEKREEVDNAILNVIPEVKGNEELLQHWQNLYDKHTQEPSWCLLGQLDGYERSSLEYPNLEDMEEYHPIPEDSILFFRKFQEYDGTCLFMIPKEALKNADFSQLTLKRLWG